MKLDRDAKFMQTVRPASEAERSNHLTDVSEESSTKGSEGFRQAHEAALVPAT
jgi:hypothetical protein